MLREMPGAFTAETRLEHLSIEALHVHLPYVTDKSRAKNRPDVKPQQRLVVLKGPRPDPWFGHICQPLVEKLVESNGSRARRSCHIPRSHSPDHGKQKLPGFLALHVAGDDNSQPLRICCATRKRKLRSAYRTWAR